MAPWYEVYDDVQMQLLTRTQAAKITAAATIALMFAIACVAFGMEGSAPLAVAAPMGVGALALFGWGCTKRLRRLRRLVWCVKLSEKEIVGYDYARRKVVLSWQSVERIDIGKTGMIVFGAEESSLEIAHLFPDFAELSHRIVCYADRNRIPIFVDGKPWQQIDVYDVFPFLSADASSRHGSATA